MTTEVTPKMDPEVSALLAKRYPSYQPLYAFAKDWNRSGSPDKVKKAAELLEELIVRYPTKLFVWYEWAFNATKQPGATVEAAKERLETIHKVFNGRLDVDSWSLWGRCYKDPGLEKLKETLATADPDQRSFAFESADKLCQAAVEKYRHAYDLDQNCFPGINIATLQFLRAGIASQLGQGDQSKVLLAEVRTLAEKLLSQSGQWKEFHKDDNIWFAATRGETKFLLGEFKAALVYYKDAFQQTNLQPHHATSMGTQLRHIIMGYSLLGEVVPPEFLAEIERLFPKVN